ncbi:MAG: heme ABC exporter ATP-binding protein CcmA [Acetobacteraceae bacterium]|nr:heme ABC exporter ATP-binding protein CcmA [Acetobacteraceae bacterium]
MLRAEDLTVIRGERLVFQGLSFSLLKGGALILAGPNGAGKSTLLRLLAGLARPDSGRLLWAGADVRADRVAHGRRVALLGHQDALKPGLTAAENLEFAARLSGRSAAAALFELGLEALADLPARVLSAGQKRRLALARVSLSSAPLWLLDEPTLGLDDAAVERLGALLSRHRDHGGMIVAATHVVLPLSGAETIQLAAP